MKIPDLKALDGATKFVTVINFIFFVAVFVGLYVIARHFVHNFFLRILCLLVIYIITSLLTYCVLKPLSDRAAEAIRSRRK